ncbi:MAG: hypothetical protein LBU94_02570 [Clostridiales bacterium]|jgi:hypothetical protein|nr:hypothetical protein [Clostridiales bacterium]
MPGFGGNNMMFLILIMCMCQGNNGMGFGGDNMLMLILLCCCMQPSCGMGMGMCEAK